MGDAKRKQQAMTPKAKRAIHLLKLISRLSDREIVAVVRRRV